MEKIKIVLGYTDYLSYSINDVINALNGKNIKGYHYGSKYIETPRCTIILIDNNINGVLGLFPDISFDLSKNAILSLPKHIVIDDSDNVLFLDFVEAIEKKIDQGLWYHDRFDKEYIINAAIKLAKGEDIDSLYPNMFISLAHGNGKRIMYDVNNNGDVYIIKTALPEIKNVIFNYPATIVFWTDGTKTVVKAQEDDVYDKEKGLAMAIAKKVLGTNESGSNYYDVFKKWIPKDEPKKREVIGRVVEVSNEDDGVRILVDTDVDTLVSKTLERMKNGGHK